MGIKDTVEMAIERSAFYDEIQDIRPESALQRELLCDELSWLCEGGSDTCGVSEYWGVDDSGRKWRVHVYPYVTSAE